MSIVNPLVVSFNKLQEGESLNMGECLISESRNYYAMMQEDGNFVVYVSNDFVYENAIFASKTNIKDSKGPFTLTLEKDQRLNIYNYENENRKIIWTANFYEKGNNPLYLIMQNDGNLVLYDSNEKALWASTTYRPTNN